MPEETDDTPDNEGDRGEIGTYSGVLNCFSLHSDWDGEEKLRKIRKKAEGTVTDLYAHIFPHYMAGAKWKECFAYSMLQRREGSWIEIKGVR